MLKRIFLAIGALGVAMGPALAHAGTGPETSFLGGFLHPLTGLDHLLAMVAVGLWAAGNGGRALIALPMAFLAAMVAGFGLALIGAPLPMIEPAILASLPILGLLIVAAVQPPIAIGALLVSVFGVFHGFAHGAEIAGAVPLLFGVGFAASTSGLMLIGVGIGLPLARGRQVGRLVARIAGGLLAVSAVTLA